MSILKSEKVIGTLIGLVGACSNNSKTDATDDLIIRALALPVLCQEIEDETFVLLVREINLEKNAVAPNCAVCASPCGNTSDYDIRRIYEAAPEIRDLKLQLLSAAQRLAAYVYQGKTSDVDSVLFYKILSYISYDIEKEQLLELLDEVKAVENNCLEWRNCMVRKIIKIDASKCNGCGACARACHEGAIEMVDNKAHLTREDYCDGLGDCLPECPCGAITFEEREAPAYNEAAVLAARQKKTSKVAMDSQLGQWPCQIKLAPVKAPYFDGADLLIAADCTAYAYANIHNDFMKGRITLIGCPKLDTVDYSDKLTEILENNNIKGITVLRMQVPCCGGIEAAVWKAIENSKKNIPMQTVTVSIEGKVLGKEEEHV